MVCLSPWKICLAIRQLSWAKIQSLPTVASKGRDRDRLISVWVQLAFFQCTHYLSGLACTHQCVKNKSAYRKKLTYLRSVFLPCLFILPVCSLHLLLTPPASNTPKQPFKVLTNTSVASGWWSQCKVKSKFSCHFIFSHASKWTKNQSGSLPICSVHHLTGVWLYLREDMTCEMTT